MPAQQRSRFLKATPITIDWQPYLSIYASELYLKSISDEYGWLGGVDDSGRLRCILPYTIIQKAFFRMVRFRVETIQLGEALNIIEETSFLNSAIEYFRSIAADMIIPASTNTIFRTYPDGAVVAPYGSYVLDLAESEKTLWKKLHPKHRNVVRNAMKKGVEIREGLEYLDTCFCLVRESFMRSAKSFSDKRRVDVMLKHDAFRNQVLALGKNVKVLSAMYEGVVQGCAVIPFSLHSAYYLHGGSIAKPVTGAMNLLHWEAIRLFREAMVRYYDFVGARINPDKGSKQESLMMFKQRFGGRLVSGYMWKYSLHPLKFAIYSLAARLLKGGDIVDQESHKLGNKVEN